MFGFGKKKDTENNTPAPAAPAAVLPEDNAPFYPLVRPAPLPEAPGSAEHTANTEKNGAFALFRRRIGKSAAAIGEGISSALTKRKLDDDALDIIEDTLILADAGPAAAAELREKLAQSRYGKDISETELRALLSDEIAAMLQEAEAPLQAESGKKPYVVMFSGVNGSGKTTAVGKIAAYATSQGKKVTIAACDTFRAAAYEQAAIWAERAGAAFIQGEENADPASVAYRAAEEAAANGSDLLLIDTAGRLQNKHNLMEQLTKLLRVLKKADPAYPHQSVIVLDATTGSNGISQIEHFRDAAALTGICMTKLDGTAKGGVLLNAVKRFGLPVFAVGTGERAEDLTAFNAEAFAKSLTGAGDNDSPSK